MNKKKAEVDRKQRYLGKMKKNIYRILLLGCLVLALIPSLLYADFYAMLKVETHPVVGNTDVTKGVQFEIKVIACNEFGEQITPATLGWDYAQFADVIFQSNDPNAQIKNILANWVSMTSPPYETRVGPGGDRIFQVILNTVGDDKRITVQQNPADCSGILDGYLDFKVHDFVDHFDISIPPGAQTAGVAFNLTIYAKDINENIAKTFNDTIDIWAVIPPDYTYEPNMNPATIAGSSFIDGLATIPVTIYGSHPFSRLVKIKCENKVMHGGYCAAGESANFAVNPNSYAKILLLVPGEEHQPGRLIGSGKEGMPDTQTAGVAFNVQVYTTDEYWNPISASVPITFTSSDLAADLPALPTMATNPETFPVTFHTVGMGTQWIRITEGAKESASTDIPVEPNDIFYFTFDNIVPSPQKTTDPFQINVTAYDADSNVTNYNQEAQLSCTMGAEYAIPDTIQFTNGTGSAWVQVTKMGLVKIIVDDGTHFVESNEFLVLAGEFNQLLVLLDGEAHTPGLGDGKDGTPNSINTGDSTTVTIIACDDYWNRKAIPVEISDISSLTGHIVPPLLPFSLAADGTGQCPVTFRTSYDAATRADEPQTITVSGGGRTTTSSPITVNSGTYDKLVLVASGEQLDPGTFDADGKSGSPATQVAGTPFTLTVAATDSYWNPVDSGFPATVIFDSGDSHQDVIFAGLPQGTAISMGARIKDFDTTLITLASPQWVTVTGGGKTNQVNIPVTHGPLDHFAFSNIADCTAGDTIFNVTITAQDQYNNTVLSFNQTASLTSTTGGETFIPTTATFISGQSIINVIIYKATFPGTAKLTCIYGGKSGESNPFVVNLGPYAKLVLILPGQTYEPGNIAEQGKSGAPFPYTVDNPPIETIVYAVDQYWNKVHPSDPEPWVEITMEEPTHRLGVDPVNPWTLSNGEATFWTTLMTAATGQVLIATDLATSINDSSTIDVNPGAFDKLQIIAPDEIPDPGSELGKIGVVQSQVAGVSFDLTVRAVDQHWNLIPAINGESIDLISVIDIGLDARYTPKPFVAGVTNFTIWLDGNNQDIDVTAISLQPLPFVNQDTVMIHVDRGYNYVVEVPTSCKAGTLSTNVFSMTVKLVDTSNNIVTDANNWFTMVPCLAIDHSPATHPEGLGENEFKLTNGEATFNQSYDIVEIISIAVNDTFGRGPVFSSGIDIRETALRYTVDVPGEATAGEVFEMDVSLIDIGTGKVVPSRDREVNLVPISGAEPGREGRLYVTNVGLSRGTWKITNQWYTKAETISIKASDAQIYDPVAEDNSSLPFQFLPGELKKLQILAPGEEPRPGEMAYIGSGKNSSNIQVQGTEIDFLVTVQAVDQYWNLVDEFSGGSVYLSSESSFSSNPVESALTHGLATFIVTSHQAGASFTLKAEAENPTSLEPQSVAIPMEVAEYRITSTVASARTDESFSLTIELVDPQTGLSKIGANNPFVITACTAGFEDAPGEVEKWPKSPVLDNGQAEIWVNYDTVGKIRFKVTDNFGRPEAYTSIIEIQPVRLCYEVIAPNEVEAGKGFLFTVKLIDTGRGKVVTPKEYESYRYVTLVAYSFPDEHSAEGKLKIESLDLEGGEKTVLQSYNFAHEIYIEATDAKAYDHPVTSEPPDRSGVIEVIGTPKTVLKLDGTYNETNDALYSRSSTLISIMCTSDIAAETILYRDNGAGWRTYAEPFTLSPGRHIIEYYGIDKYGHKEGINQSKTIYVSFFSAGADGVLNRPNPFRAGRQDTYIEYNLKEESNVTITIYDLFGQEVWRESYRAGENGGIEANSVPWDGRNLSGEVVGNGGYICRVWIEKEKRHMLRKIAVAK
ncbi:hypothetical protein ES705_12761 [subsurface metagenome]|nr:hypothetical protein [Clostridia bacterium]